jgi:hypothetical protein
VWVIFQVITRFGQQLRELVGELDTTGLHFVRCIKPNAQLQPNNMDPAATLHQLRWVSMECHLPLCMVRCIIALVCTCSIALGAECPF